MQSNANQIRMISDWHQLSPMRNYAYDIHPPAHVNPFLITQIMKTKNPMISATPHSPPTTMPASYAFVRPEEAEKQGLVE